MDLFSALIGIASLTVLAPLDPTAPPTLHGVWPTNPHHVIRIFEPPSDAFSAGHRGVDLEAAVGTPVVTSLSGTVTFAGTIAGRDVIVVSHGETRTTYEPVIADVHEGDIVGSGDRLGTLDITQSHCFPTACLHWGWLKDKEYLDPLLLVQGRPHVRLLPLMPVDAPADRQP